MPTSCFPRSCARRGRPVWRATRSEPGGLRWRAIAAKAAEAGCDLIVMASHGRHGIARFVPGSETAQAPTHAWTPCR
ncbi:hypothetical protein B1991_09550 [Rhodanobacter lindaniclasticus]|uniref:UspA domain-containing protein n=1 Tax=Rhodanobacter lindaniclasticus TaxID=75310 RepID=A0A4S3KF14_9GAMM|nr:hypothetical protein B1991_09550 [Rhodanobacter lindaniclasticus]